MARPSPEVPSSGGRPEASSRWTQRSLVVGSTVSAACFLVAIVLELLGRPDVPASFDPATVVSSVLGLRPSGWAALGAVAVILTPALSLAATAFEYRASRDRRTLLAALAVLVILGASLAVGLAR